MCLLNFSYQVSQQNLEFARCKAEKNILKFNSHLLGAKSSKVTKQEIYLKWIKTQWSSCSKQKEYSFFCSVRCSVGVLCGYIGYTYVELFICASIYILFTYLFKCLYPYVDVYKMCVRQPTSYEYTVEYRAHKRRQARSIEVHIWDHNTGLLNRMFACDLFNSFSSLSTNECKLNNILCCVIVDFLHCAISITVAVHTTLLLYSRRWETLPSY